MREDSKKSNGKEGRSKEKVPERTRTINMLRVLSINDY